MRYPTATALVLILLAALASRAAADSFGGVLNVIEVAEREKDPWALFKLQTVEVEIAEYGQLIENLRREGSQIVIERRRTFPNEAKRLQAGVIVDFVAENVSRSHTVAGTAWRRDWIGPLDLEEVTK